MGSPTPRSVGAHKNTMCRYGPPAVQVRAPHVCASTGPYKQRLPGTAIVDSSMFGFKQTTSRYTSGIAAHERQTIWNGDSAILKLIICWMSETPRKRDGKSESLTSMGSLYELASGLHIACAPRLDCNPPTPPPYPCDPVCQSDFSTYLYVSPGRCC